MKRTSKMRAAQKFLIASLICLPTVAFANAYPLNPALDVFLDTINVTSASNSMQNVAFTAVAEDITDVASGCAQCFAGLTFTQSGGTFSITSGNTTYLTGTLTSFVIEAGGEVGEIFRVTSDNIAAWTALEGAAASSFGGSVVLDLHLFNPDGSGSEVGADGDLTATPEPASLTLVLAGLAAGLARKRLARKRS
jgi:hypothetical protein